MRSTRSASAALGGYDVVVANAAEAASGVTDMDEAALLHAIALNFTHYLLLTQRAARDMTAAKRSGNPDGTEEANRV